MKVKAAWSEISSCGNWKFCEIISTSKVLFDSTANINYDFNIVFRSILSLDALWWINIWTSWFNDFTFYFRLIRRLCDKWQFWALRNETQREMNRIKRQKIAKWNNHSELREEEGKHFLILLASKISFLTARISLVLNVLSKII